MKLEKTEFGGDKKVAESPLRVGDSLVQRKRKPRRLRGQGEEKRGEESKNDGRKLVRG